MKNSISYRCTITNPKNARKKCVITTYQDGKYIYFSMVCHAAKIGINIYGNMDSIINYVKKYGQMLSRLTRVLLIDERYIFANIVECVVTANSELKGGVK